jgi:release factor glutamine methyltransferase
VSNPPYVEAGAELGPELDFEPAQALRAGPDGLEVIRRLVPAARGAGAHFLAIEVGEHQAADLNPDDVIKDLAGRDRVVVYRW